MFSWVPAVRPSSHVLKTLLIVMRRTTVQAFAALGAKMSDHVEIARVEPAAYRAHYGDGTKFDLVYDMEVMRRQVPAECKIK
jgi:hypothetical protein